MLKDSCELNAPGLPLFLCLTHQNPSANVLFNPHLLHLLIQSLHCNCQRGNLATKLLPRQQKKDRGENYTTFISSDRDIKGELRCCEKLFTTLLNYSAFAFRLSKKVLVSKKTRLNINNFV
ncbi:hypothetical protein ILYODFUR_002847 [Ilyodon furcidens]|uniref:Uncharacterized protein n=1 Tax=Ilyodon furcidens TaxID=33524 RepID=A0ABV0THC4_9TELE